MLRIGIVLLFSLALAASSSVAQPASSSKELVAVMDMESIGATKAQISACSERLREELLQTNQFRLVDRSEMAKIMEEQALQQTGCTSQECMVKVGRILGVRKLVTGRVTKVEDDLWMVSGMLLDVESAETLRVASVQHDGNFRTLLGPGMAALAVKLRAPSPAPEPAAPATKPASPSTAPTSTAVAAPRPPSALSSGGKANVAIFPVLHTICRDSPSSCGRHVSEPEIAGAVATALKATGKIQVAASFYPEATQGTPLGRVAAEFDPLWSGVFSKAPNPSMSANKGKSLGVDLVAMLSSSSDAKHFVFDFYLIEVKSNRVYNRRFSVLRDTSGRMDQNALNRELADLVQVVR